MAEPLPDDDDGPPSDPESVARTICLRALTQGARSRSELAATLLRKGVPDEAARTVLDRFTEVGLIDDVALADGYAQAAHRERGLSGRAVAMKLRQRGIDDDTVQSAISSIDPASERAAARALIQRKLPALRGVDPQAQVRRLVSLLARRGYSPGLAYDVVREVVADARLETTDFDHG